MRVLDVATRGTPHRPRARNPLADPLLRLLAPHAGLPKSGLLNPESTEPCIRSYEPVTLSSFPSSASAGAACRSTEIWSTEPCILSYEPATRAPRRYCSRKSAAGTSIPKPQTQHPELQHPSPKPKTPNSKPQTPDPRPQPQTPDPNPKNTSMNGVVPPSQTNTPTPFTLHPTPNTQHPTPYTLHPTAYTVHPTPYTIHHTPYILPFPSPNPKPQSRNLTGASIRSRQEIPNPKA